MNISRHVYNHLNIALSFLKKHTTISLCVFGCIVGMAIVGVQPYLRDSVLRVYFLDVGQGDAIFIETPNRKKILIDAGRDQMIIEQLGKELSFFDRTIDIILATHSDADHIGGFPYLFDRYKIPLLIESEISSPTTTDRVFNEKFIYEKSDRLLGRAGERIILDPKRGIVLDILFPDQNPYNWETNEASIVAKLSYGDTSFLLTGDAPAEVEDHLVRIYGDQLRAQVLKLGHHGSKTSSSTRWLETVLPDIVIVSAGLGNKYGHPNIEVIDRVSVIGATIHETSVSGTIRCLSDGKHILCSGSR